MSTDPKTLLELMHSAATAGLAKWTDKRRERVAELQGYFDAYLSKNEQMLLRELCGLKTREGYTDACVEIQELIEQETGYTGPRDRRAGMQLVVNNEQERQ